VFFSVSGDAGASRNNAGTYSRVSNYVIGTVIDAVAVNAEESDFATEMTDSLSRSGKGGMLAALAAFDGSVNIPGYGWVNEAGSGLFRAGAADLRMSISQSAKTFWNATGFGVGAAPTHLFDISAAGSAATVISSFLEPAIANGNALTFNVGQANAGNQAGSLTYTQNVVAANSTWCMGVAGTPSTLCVDGNAKATVGGAGGLQIGTAGTAISKSNRGTASLTPAAILTQTCQAQSITVTGAVAGGECAYSIPAGGNVGLSIACNASADSCGLTMCNPTAGSLTPSAGTYSCRVFNP